jgi:hypothetical protein
MGRTVLGWALSLDRDREEFSVLDDTEVHVRAYLPVRASEKVNGRAGGELTVHVYA